MTNTTEQYYGHYPPPSLRTTVCLFNRYNECTSDDIIYIVCRYCYKFVGVCLVHTHSYQAPLPSISSLATTLKYNEHDRKRRNNTIVVGCIRSLCEHSHHAPSDSTCFTCKFSDVLLFPTNIEKRNIYSKKELLCRPCGYALVKQWNKEDEEQKQ
jgi:hypothetical protein